MNIIPSVVVLGVGNMFMQDDGIGVRAVRALANAYEFPPRVRLVEAGTMGLRLLSELDGAGHLLIIDAVSGKERPGSIYRLTPEDLPKEPSPLISAHEVGITEVLAAAELIGEKPRTRILGVQPLEVREAGLELTPPLEEALPSVVAAALEELKAMGVEVQKKNLQPSASADHA